MGLSKQRLFPVGFSVQKGGCPVKRFFGEDVAREQKSIEAYEARFLKKKSERNLAKWFGFVGLSGLCLVCFVVRFCGLMCWFVFDWAPIFLKSLFVWLVFVRFLEFGLLGWLFGLLALLFGWFGWFGLGCFLFACSVNF